MKLVLQTFNGVSITGYAAKIIEGPHTFDADVIDVPRVNESVAYAGKSFQPRKFEIAFTLRQSQANFNTDAEAIGKLFNTRNGLAVLVANDTNDSNTPYYLDCTPVKFLPIKASTLKIQMWTADPVWKKVTATTDTIAVSASGTTTDTIANAGNVDAYPTVTITPTSIAGAYPYRRHIIAYNPVAFLQANYPLEITGGGIDTSALVKDTTVSNQLNGGIDDTVTTIDIDTAVGGGLPASGVGALDTEQISWTGNSGTQLTGVTRGINGTTAAAHLDNAVISRSLIQGNGNDIRVLINGVPYSRWLGGTVISDTTLKIWSVLDFQPKLEMTLGAAIGGASGVTSITIANTAANIAMLKRLPDKGIIYIDTEAIAYTAKNLTARKLTIADEGRGIKDTTAATHSNGATVRWIQYDIVVQYGNLSAETLVQDETRKPVFSLENSSNTNWRYDSADSVFADLAGLRAGAWKPTLPKGKYSNWYTGNEATFGTDPVTDMGAQIINYLSGLVYKAETGEIRWTIYNPAGFTSNSSLGSKYKLSATTPFPVCRLQSSKDGITWVNEWTETTPGSAATWTAWTRASEAVPAGTKYLRFLFTGAVKGGSAEDYAMNEVNLGAAGSNGVSMESTGVPQIVIKNQASNAQIDVVLANTTTGDSLTVAFPMAANTPLVINTENRQISYQNRLLAPPELSSVRQEWLRLQPGNNTITYTDSSAGNVTVGFSYKERKNM